MVRAADAHLSPAREQISVAMKQKFILPALRKLTRWMRSTDESKYVMFESAFKSVLSLWVAFIDSSR